MGTVIGVRVRPTGRQHSLTHRPIGLDPFVPMQPSRLTTIYGTVTIVNGVYHLKSGDMVACHVAHMAC